MIPVKDTVTDRGYSYVTIGIMGVCILMFGTVMFSGPHARLLFGQFGFSPSACSSNFNFPGTFIKATTSLFLHSSVPHILMNIWYLYLFGRTIEDEFGHGLFFIFFWVCGMSALGCQALALPSPIDPKVMFVGASGAISGVLGAYLISHTRTKIILLLPLIVVFLVFEIPSFFPIVFWYGSQLIPGLAKAQATETISVAWWGHLGGFATGVLFAIIYRDMKLKREND